MDKHFTVSVQLSTEFAQILVRVHRYYEEGFLTKSYWLFRTYLVERADPCFRI
mgnify:CR=1 FL=1